MRIFRFSRILLTLVVDENLQAGVNNPGQQRQEGLEEDDQEDDAVDPARQQQIDPDFNDDEELDIDDQARELDSPVRRRAEQKNNELVSHIEKEAEINRKHREYMEKLEGKKARRGNISTAVLAEDCDNLIAAMRHAYEADIAANKQGRPGLEKLKIIATVLKKMKNLEFAGIFLDANGLEIINNFISMLPDGSWPLSNVRSKIYELIYRLPASVDHLRSTKLGRTLALLQESKKEFRSNKKLIQMIKDKWSRIICTIPVDYTHLEQCERNYMNMPLYTKREQDIEDNVSNQAGEEQSLPPECSNFLYFSVFSCRALF